MSQYTTKRQSLGVCILRISNHFLIFLWGLVLLYLFALICLSMSLGHFPEVLSVGGSIFLLLFILRLLQVIVKWNLPPSVRYECDDVI